MVFVPSLLALSLTAVTDGWTGVRALGSKLGQWRVRLKWIVMALALGLVLRMTMSGIAVVLGLISAIQLRPWSPMQLTIFAVILFIFAIPEELGWRGYALPKLLKAQSPLVASLIIGVVWGSLHLALHLPGMIYAGALLLPTFREVIALSVAMTWLFIRSGGNILLTSLFHAAQSFFVIVNEGIPLEQQAWLMASVYVALALMIAIAAGPRFARKPLPEPSLS
jgi:membrane protease YdiL (CAAX protease family)